jgi:hypothetical protein
MRLLRLSSSGQLTQTVFDSERPPYAILSHTWGTDELTFRDVVEGHGKNKAGYRKIQFCAEQAARDGLQYFWVDTCSIDKSSSAELQEGIISMYDWYRSAEVCYVYLSDVSMPEGENWALATTDADGTEPQYIWEWERAFRSSRWHTRGWTLQELLAPATVQFFSVEGRRIGDKKSLERQLLEISRIPVRALRGAAMSYFDVAERMSWAASRQTTRKEDMAYSLMGIFGVYIPILYGEGQDRAVRRLREEINKQLYPQTEKHGRLPNFKFTRSCYF